MRPIVTLQIAYHIEHGVICETLAEDCFYDPLFALLRHTCLGILLLD